MTRGPIITTCQKIMAPAASYLVTIMPWQRILELVSLNDSLDTAKNPATDSMAHVHHTNSSSVQDRAVLQHAGNVGSDIQNTNMVSCNCSVME